LNQNDKKSFFLGVFGLSTQRTYVEFTFIAMKCFLGDGSRTNIAKGIIIGFEILFFFERMVSGTDINLVAFTMSTIVKLALLASPRDFGLTLLNCPVANYTDFWITRNIIENVFRILID
jgi:hypothetical protein